MLFLLLLSFYNIDVLSSSFDYSVELEYLDNYKFDQYHQYYHYYHNYLLSNHDNTYYPIDYEDIYNNSKYIKVKADHDDYDQDIKRLNYNNFNFTIDNIKKLRVKYSYNKHDDSHVDNNIDDDNNNLKIKIHLNISYHNITNLNNILQKIIEFDVNEKNYKQIKNKGKYPDDKIQMIVIQFIHDDNQNYQQNHHHYQVHHNSSIHNHNSNFDLYHNQSHISTIHKHNITTIIGTAVDEFLLLYPWWYIEKDIDSYQNRRHIPHTISKKKKSSLYIHNDYYIVLQKYPLYEALLRYANGWNDAEYRC